MCLIRNVQAPITKEKAKFSDSAVSYKSDIWGSDPQPRIYTRVEVSLYVSYLSSCHLLVTQVDVGWGEGKAHWGHARPRGTGRLALRLTVVATATHRTMQVLPDQRRRRTVFLLNSPSSHSPKDARSSWWSGGDTRRGRARREISFQLNTLQINLLSYGSYGSYGSYDSCGSCGSMSCESVTRNESVLYFFFLLTFQIYNFNCNRNFYTTISFPKVFDLVHQLHFLKFTFVFLFILCVREREMVFFFFLIFKVKVLWKTLATNSHIPTIILTECWTFLNSIHARLPILGKDVRPL